MIGIDYSDGQGYVAAFLSSRPKILDKGESIKALVDIAKGHVEIPVEQAAAAVTVPAWYNDEQRRAVIEEAKAAGLGQVRLVNRPTAVAYAYSALEPGERTNVLVLDFLKNSFDVTVLSRTEDGFEVLASDGGMNLDPAMISDSAKFYAEVESAITRALKQSGTGLEKLEAILYSGRSQHIESIKSKLTGFFGREGSTAVTPEHAAALGASVFAALLEQRQKGPGTAPTTESGPKSSGCLIVMGVVLLVVVLLLL